MYIGLDLGTSGLKAVLMDSDQNVVAEATAPLSVSRPFEGWSEQNPADWIGAAERVLDALAAHGLGDVRAIGLRLCLGDPHVQIPRCVCRQSGAHYTLMSTVIKTVDG